MSRKRTLDGAKIKQVADNLAQRPDAASMLTQEQIAIESGVSISSVRKVLGSINNFRRTHNLPSLGEHSNEVRKDSILNAALTVAARPGGWWNLTRELVAKEAGCTDGLVSRYFGTMTDFRRTIMRTAITRKDLSIVGQGVACGYPHAMKADIELRKAALNSLDV